MKRVLYGALGTVSLLVAACSTPTATESVQSSATPAGFSHASRECHREQEFLEGSRGLVTLHMHAYANCMKADGWGKQTDDEPG